VPETPEQLYERVKDDLRPPSVEEWEAWPFEGVPPRRPLRPPLDAEPPLHGEGGIDCWRCNASDDDYIWTSERWRIRVVGPTGMPMIGMLEPREHYALLGDLPEELSADLGPQLTRLDRAIRSLGEIGNVLVCRFGDGSEHLHWWLIARPARFEQLRTNLVMLWDDVLPPFPDEIWQADVDAIRAALAA
jgi:diadenosine tetraphosphate (Ap4A) HIT family hydrolase